MTPSEKQRAAVLGVCAVLMVSYLAVKLASRATTEEPVAAPKRDTSKPAPPPVVARGHEDLAKKFKPIVDVDAFHAHLFGPKKSGRRGGDRGGGGGGDDTAAETSGATTSSSSSFALRLTGVFADDRGCTALLEDRGTGKGIFVKRGDRLGDRTVADVRTGSIVLEASVAPLQSKTSVIEFNDKVDVKEDVVAKLVTFTFAPVSSSSSSSSGSVPNLPPLSDAEKDDVLKRLREKARKSRGLAADAAAPAEPRGDSK